MALNTAQKLIKSHLVEGSMVVGEEISLKIDQTLTQDATGTMVMLELESMGLSRAKTEISVQYVDHNLIQEDFKNPDDHLFLQSASQRFGLWFSRPGNGISHPVHMQNFGQPGKTLLGSDSHTPAAGSLGMLAIGAGGLDVATAIAGEPFYLKMPKIFGIKLVGRLPDWVSAKDIILEMLRRYDVKGGVGYILEYYGPGLKNLSIMDRHVIANMGAELGATSTVFPSDKVTLSYLKSQHRADAWVELASDRTATYDKKDQIDLSKLVPLIAKPSSPGNVVPVKDVQGLKIYQSYIGSSANPGFRDFAMVAEILKGHKAYNNVSLDINPSTRTVLEELVASGHLGHLLQAGARIHQAGCNGCIGMGQAPATGRNSVRTVPRNFPGRSGTPEDAVFLCSPETAAASAINGYITDPRDLEVPYPQIALPKPIVIHKGLLLSPLPEEDAKVIELIKGPNIQSLPKFDAYQDTVTAPVLLKLGDNISTDDISPAGAKVLPFRSNIPKISEFCFRLIDGGYTAKALAIKEDSGHIIIAGENYAQGSSREHAALAPRYLGLHVVISKSIARIHWQNLINFGILPVTFVNKSDYDKIDQEDQLIIPNIINALEKGTKLMATIKEKNINIPLQHVLSKRQIKILLAGGLINWLRDKS